MASCFRSVPSRLCCSNYLKASPIAYLDVTNSTSTKITPPMECPKQTNYSFQVATINNISNHKEILNNRNTLCAFSSPPSDLTSHDIIMWYRRKNGLIASCPPAINESFRNHTLLLAEPVKSDEALEPENCGRPSDEHLERVYQTLSIDLPKLFVRPMDYTIFNKDIILENNIKGKRTVGLMSYVSQIALLKTVGHFKFAHVKFIVLKITKHPEDGTIKCRWRIQGLSALKAIGAFFVMKGADAISAAPTWYDGFSIYYLNSNGEVYKHIIDKMQPDDDKIVDEKPATITKLALYLGLVPQKEQVLFMSILNDYLRDNSCLSEVMLPLNKIE